MTRAEQAALEAYPHYMAENLDGVTRAREFFAKGYKQAEKDLGWISVNDKLPKVGHFVLTCVDDSGTPQSVGMALLLKNGTWWDGDMKVYVDYWMEVPKLKK